MEASEMEMEASRPDMEIERSGPRWPLQSLRSARINSALRTVDENFRFTLVRETPHELWWFKAGAINSSDYESGNCAGTAYSEFTSDRPSVCAGAAQHDNPIGNL